MYLLPGLVSVLAVTLFLVLSFRVGQARGTFGVTAPATNGPIEFERVYRVQQNTMEQLVGFLPALWLFTIFTGASLWASGLGLVWLVGRLLYAQSYAQGKNRFPGFLLTILPTSILLIGALVAIVMQLAIAPGVL